MYENMTYENTQVYVNLESIIRWQKFLFINMEKKNNKYIYLLLLL